MRWILFLLPLLPASAPLVSPAGERCLDRRTALYYEDAIVPRPIASVTAELVEAGDARLRVTVSAIGAGVDPLPGLTGAPGANLRTAEELDRLLRDGALALVTRQEGVSEPGRCAAIEWRAVPVRRIGADGRIDFTAETAARWPVRVTFESAPLSAGETWSYLEADGVPRLAVRVADGRIAELESRPAWGK